MALSEEELAFLKGSHKIGRRIQHRFAAEPVLAKTGKGYLKSEGVERLAQIKQNIRNSQVKHEKKNLA